MTRKSHKGITGKQLERNKDKKDVGPGISFTDRDLKTGEDIEQAVKNDMKK